MIGRGALGNPWVFRRLAAAWRGAPDPGPPTMAERWAALRRHYDLYLEIADVGTTVRELRKHLSWYTKGLPDSAAFRAHAQTLDALADVRAAVDGFFGSLLMTARAGDVPIAPAPPATSPSGPPRFAEVAS
jgi:tRNA-dihydrouridine synthase